MKPPHWIPESCIPTVHQQLLNRFGGLAGIRDPGMLESALNRPKLMLQYDPGADIWQLSAALTAAIVKNHPFLDGNKRLGFMAAYILLGINGFRLIAPEEQAVIFTRGLAAGEVEEAEYAAWLKASTEAK